MPVKRSTKMIEVVIVMFLLKILASIFICAFLERFTCKKWPFFPFFYFLVKSNDHETQFSEKRKVQNNYFTPVC
jgi:hypothetical protein